MRQRMDQISAARPRCPESMRCHGFIMTLSRDLSSAVGRVESTCLEAIHLTVSEEHTPAILGLKDLTPDRAVVRRLPRDLARRYRALPIAQDTGGTTVVMVNPADQEARAGVMAALSTLATGRRQAASQVYLVQGDPATIDRWLADSSLWDRDPQHGGADDADRLEWSGAQEMGVWLRDPLHGDRDLVLGYAEHVASLLHARLYRVDPLAPGPTVVQQAAASPPSVVLLPCLDHNLLSSLLNGASNDGPAVLFGRRPCWPLHRLLLIVRGDRVDDAALAWAARLTRTSGASAAALMIAPHASALSVHPAQDGISNLLSPTHAIGRKMQHAAQGLAAMQLDAVLHLRQGEPEVVIREELASAPYDLVIAGIAVRDAEAQWRLRPLLHKLLPELTCPLLLTRGS